MANFGFSFQQYSFLEEFHHLHFFGGGGGGGAKGREQGALWEMRKWLIASLPSLALKQNINATSMITYC